MRQRTILLGPGVLALLPLLVAGVLLLPSGRGDPVAALPTLFVLPSETPTSTPTWTATTTHTPTSTLTPTATTTPTATATLTPTLTPTLATRVVEISAVMPGVYVPPTATPFPAGTILLPAPPQPVEPLPDATHEPPPYSGWYSYESDHPVVRYAPARWEPRLHVDASRGQYHRTENPSAYVTVPFEGEGLRVRYVAARNMGVFEIIVDGRRIDTVNANADQLRFSGTRVYTLDPGPHTLTLRPTGSGVFGLDAVQVYRSDARTLIVAPADTPTLEPSSQTAAVELISAPPTPAPTLDAAAPLAVAVVIAYDENGNREIDPAEGVAGISVRAVTTDTNQAVAQAFTDSSGYAQIVVPPTTGARIVVPYFGTVWAVSPNANDTAQFTLLLDPGNQPGLIP